MLNKWEVVQKRFGGVNQKIDLWLQERKQLVTKYCRLTGISKGHPQPVWEVLKEFDGQLIDYASRGHFDVYDELIQETSDLEEGREDNAKEIVHQLQANTQKLMGFHDYCNEEYNIFELADKLTHLGPYLEERFALEDHLIAILHDAFKNETHQ